MSHFLLTHERHGVCVSDRPLGVFDRGHDPMRYRRCLNAIELLFTDNEAWEDLFTDAEFEVDPDKPKKGSQLVRGRLFQFQAVYGNRSGKTKRNRTQP